MRAVTQSFWLTGLLVGAGVTWLSCADQESIRVSKSTPYPPMTISDSNSNRFDVAEFERNRELWTSKNIQHYKMIIGASGFLTNFPEEVLVEVRNRKPKSVKSLSKTGRNATDTYKGYDTVENLFGFVDEQGRRGARKLQVKYDAGLGYPAQIEVDQDGFRGNDDELILEIKGFEIIDK